jgi:hypothetical protein
MSQSGTACTLALLLEKAKLMIERRTAGWSRTGEGRRPATVAFREPLGRWTSESPLLNERSGQSFAQAGDATAVPVSNF